MYPQVEGKPYLPGPGPFKYKRKRKYLHHDMQITKITQLDTCFYSYHGNVDFRASVYDSLQMTLFNLAFKTKMSSFLVYIHTH